MAFKDYFIKKPQLEPHTLTVETGVGNTMTDVYSFNLKTDYTKPFQTNYRNSNGFYFGADNAYPDDLNNLYNSSPLHSRSIQLKKLLTVGEGFDVDGKDKLDGESKIKLNQLLNQFENMYDNLAFDYFLHSRVYIQITWNSNNTKIIKLERIAPEKIRVAEVDNRMQPTSYYYCYDWSQLGRFGKVKIAKFDQQNTKEKVQLYVHQVESAGMKTYALPSYVSGLNWVVLDSEMSAYHKSNITNSLNPSMLIEFFRSPANDEEKQKTLQSLNDSFAGSRNTGKVMVLFNPSVDSAAKVTQLEPNKLDKTFMSLTDTIQRQILYSHSINPILLGLKTAGSLGDSGEVESSYKLFNKSIIKPAQKDLERIFNSFITTNGLYNELHFKEADIYTIQTQITETNNPI